MAALAVTMRFEVALSEGFFGVDEAKPTQLVSITETSLRSYSTSYLGRFIAQKIRTSLRGSLFKSVQRPMGEVASNPPEPLACP